MTYKVYLTRRATREVDDILAWISARSSQGAISWAARWDDFLAQLARNPDVFGRAPEGEKHDAQIRHAIFKTRRGRPYRAHFVVDKDQIFVIHVRGPGQDILSIDDLQFPE